MDDKKSIELIRPMSEDRYFLVGVLGGICFVAGGLAAVVASAIGWDQLAHPRLLLAVGVGVFLLRGSR